MPQLQNDNDVWAELGNHGARITNLETGEGQRQQWQNNHRAETLGLVKELKDDIYTFVKPLADDVASIKKLLWMGGGGFATVMFMLELFRTFIGK